LHQRSGLAASPAITSASVTIRRGHGSAHLRERGLNCAAKSEAFFRENAAEITR
jgi:hypothetical protein